MNSSQIFFNFLKIVKPELSKKIKKTDGETYQTYGSLKETGCQFFYNTKKQLITKIFFQSTFNGYEYGKEMASEMFDVILSDAGFKVSKKI